MKIARKKPTTLKKNKVVARPKRSFDAKAFANSLNSLNKDNYGSAPLAVRLFVIALITALLLGLAYALLLKPKLEEITAAEAQRDTLLDVYKERESKARQLDVYKDQVAQMEVEFQRLLQQLPTDTRIPELVEGINMVGSGSNIRFQEISVPEAIEKEFFIEQPINITALGNYHQFGDFLTGLSALPRIITMHDFEVTRQSGSDIMTETPQLMLKINTNTYRSKQEAEVAAETEATTDASTETEGGNP